MEYKKFILKNGVEIPVIGFGTGVIKKIYTQTFGVCKRQDKACFVRSKALEL